MPEKSEKINSMEVPRDFAIGVMANNNFQSSQELASFIKNLPYCLAPWLHSHVTAKGERKLCCDAKPSGIDFKIPFDQYWNSQYLQGIREKMLQQVPPEECLRCINHIGPKSPKSLYLHLLLKMPHLSQLQWNSVNNQQPISLDYRLNLENEILERLDQGKIIDINCVDDLPFSLMPHKRILDYLVSKNLSKDVILRYSSQITNLHEGEVFIPQYLKENFLRVIFSITIEATQSLESEEWHHNYHLLKECLGETSIRLNITVSIPVLLDIINLSNFLDKENRDASIHSLFPSSNELLLSPLALERHTLHEIISKRLIGVKNIEVKKYLENLLVYQDSLPLNNLIENFEAIRTYYIKTNTVKFLSSHPELKQWWNLICPHELQSSIPQKHSTIVKISAYVPNEIGRIFYFASFYILKVYLKFKYGNNVELWYRNSVSQDFFKFGKSDLDLSIEIKKQSDLIGNYNGIKEILFKCPLVKEVNVYYPFAIGKISFLANSFEIQRDRVLMDKMKTTSKVTNEQLRAQSLCFLLRMLFSNQKIYENGLHGRDLKKWHYYLSHSGHLKEATLLREDMTFLELASLVLNTFFLQTNAYAQQTSTVFSAIINKIRIHILFADLKKSVEVLSLFPQLFCSLDLEAFEVPSLMEDIFLAQISWEVASVLTQLSGDLAHLNNLSRCLSRATFNRESNIKLKEDLLLTIESIRSFLSTQVTC